MSEHILVVVKMNIPPTRCFCSHNDCVLHLGFPAARWLSPGSALFQGAVEGQQQAIPELRSDIHINT